MPTVDVVIVNWNAMAHLPACLDALAASQRDGFDPGSVIVVDNASSDGSRAWLAGRNDVTLLGNDANRGFGAACNQGAARGRGELILFLNPDVILDPGAIGAAVAAIAGPWQPPAGIAGARLRDGAGCTQRTCARFPRPASMIAAAAGLDRWLPGVFPPHFLVEWDHGTTRPVDQVMGAFFLVRRTVFEALGGFDERFFVYFEDLDFALRARAAGWCSLHVAEATAMHAGGGSSRQVPARRLFYWLRSRSLYARKHFGAAWAAALLAVALLVEPLARLVHGLVAGRAGNAGHVFAAYREFIGWLITAGQRQAAQGAP